MIPRFYRSLELAQANLEQYTAQAREKIYLSKRIVTSNTGPYLEYRYITETELKNCSTFEIIDECAINNSERAGQYLSKILEYKNIRGAVPRIMPDKPDEFLLYTKAGNVYRIHPEKVGTFEIDAEEEEVNQPEKEKEGAEG